MPTLKPRRRPKIIRVPASSAALPDRVVSATSTSAPIAAAAAAAAVPDEIVSSLAASGHDDSSEPSKKRPRRQKDSDESEKNAGKGRASESSSRLPLAGPQPDQRRSQAADAAPSNEGTIKVSHVGRKSGPTKSQGRLEQFQRKPAESIAETRASFLHCSMMNAAAATMAFGPFAGFAYSQAWSGSNTAWLAGYAAGGTNTPGGTDMESSSIFTKGTLTERGTVRKQNDLNHILQQSKRIREQSEANMALSQLPYIYASMQSQSMMAACATINATSGNDNFVQKRKSGKEPDTRHAPQN